MSLFVKNFKHGDYDYQLDEIISLNGQPGGFWIRWEYVGDVSISSRMWIPAKIDGKRITRDNIINSFANLNNEDNSDSTTDLLFELD